MPDERNEIEITLTTMEELFGEPGADPFDPQRRSCPAISSIPDR